MVFKKIGIFLLFIISTNICFAATSHIAKGYIVDLKVRTDLLETVAVRGIITFRLLRTPLEFPCTHLYFNKNDIALTNFIISAKAGNGEVQILYYSDIVSPATNKHCAIGHATLK